MSSIWCGTHKDTLRPGKCSILVLAAWGARRVPGKPRIYNYAAYHHDHYNTIYNIIMTTEITIFIALCMSFENFIIDFIIIVAVGLTAII